MFIAVHSTSTSDNQLVALSVHSTLEAASAAALAAAQSFAAAQSEFEVETYAADMLDAHVLATYAVGDDCFLVTQSLDALLAARI